MFLATAAEAQVIASCYLFYACKFTFCDFTNVLLYDDLLVQVIRVLFLFTVFARVLTPFKDYFARLCALYLFKDFLCQSLSTRRSECNLIVSLICRNVGRIREFRFVSRRQIFLFMTNVLC